MLVPGLRRVEERLDAVEARLDKLALGSELVELKSRVDGLQEQVRTLEQRLGAWLLTGAAQSRSPPAPRSGYLPRFSIAPSSRGLEPPE